MEKIEKFIEKEFKKTRYYEIKFTLFIVLIIIAIGIFFQKISFNDFILLFTFGALLWYSFETRELKIATQKQLYPFLFLYLEKIDQLQSNSILYLSNLGKTPVSNVFIEPIPIGDIMIEFNILQPIYHIMTNEKYKHTRNKKDPAKIS